MSSIRIYRPNAKNLGHAASFTFVAGTEKSSPSVYIQIVRQASWDGEKRIGTFHKGNQGDDNSISVKLSPWELGAFIYSIDTQTKFNTVHKFERESTQIVFNTFSGQGGATVWGLSIGRGEKRYTVSLTLADAIVLRQFLVNSLDKLIEADAV